MKQITLESTISVGCPYREDEKDEYNVTLIYTDPDHTGNYLEVGEFAKILETFETETISGEDLADVLAKEFMENLLTPVYVTLRTNDLGVKVKLTVMADAVPPKKVDPRETMNMSLGSEE